jgi:hypothetical protein
MSNANKSIWFLAVGFSFLVLSVLVSTAVAVDLPF